MVDHICNLLGGIVLAPGSGYRAGFLSRAKTRKALLRSGRASEDTLWALFQDLVAEAVGSHRFFDFQQLGFADPAPQLRFLGTTRPELVVVAEKASLHENLRALRQQFGVTRHCFSLSPRGR